MPLTVRCHQSDDDLPQSLLDGWRRLAADAHLPYALPEWVLASWRGYRRPLPRTQLRLLVAQDGEEVVAVAPFAAEGPERFRLSAWSTPSIGQRHGPVAAAGREVEAAAAFAAWLATEADPAPSELLLWASDAKAPWGRALRDTWPGRVAPALWRVDRTPAPVADLSDGYEPWLARRAASQRQSLRRYARAVNRRGGVIRRIDDPAEAPAALDALFALHADRFAAVGKRSVLTDGHRAAVRDAVAALLPLGQARLLICTADDAVVGASLSVRAGDRVCGWGLGFRPEWAKQSLGLVLLDASVRDAAEAGARVLDLGGGGQDYKVRLADADEPLVTERLIMRDRRWPAVHASHAPAHARRAARAVGRRLPAQHVRRARVLMAALAR
jgi:CelD/BcsL family acetyltransferase involved in cellulose biosynthesis